MKIRAPRWLAGAGALGLAIGLGACGSSSSSSGTPSSTSASTNLSQASALYSKFTQGSVGKADASKSSVAIGFINDEGGIPSFPESSVAAQAAVKFVNDNLGGVKGHPVTLNTCLVAGGEEDGVRCAQQFLGAHVGVIVENVAVVGAQAFHQSLASKIPVVIGTPASLADATAKNAYGLSAGVFGTDPGFVNYATKYAHARTVSLLFPGDDPTGQVAGKQIKQTLTQVGIKVTDVGYKSSSPDMLPSVIASGASKADLVVALFPSPPTCIAGAKALKQANVTTPVVTLSSCVSPAVKQAVGDYPKWAYVSVATNPEVSGDPATDSYLQVMKAYASANANTGGFAQGAFTPVLAAVRALNLAGGAGATPAAIGTQLKSWTGPTPMLNPNVKYGAIPSLPTIPSLQTRLYTYEGSGHWTDVTHGRWVLPGK